MLVLSRRKGESLLIGEHIILTVLEVQSDKVKIGIEAPRDISVLRKELFDSISSENVQASKAEVSKVQADQIDALLKTKKPGE